MKRLPIFLPLLLALPAMLPAAEDPAALFVRRVLPLLQEKCLACHGKDEKKIKGDLDLRTREATLKGGESGDPAIVAGQPEKSPLYLSVTRQHADDWEPMPPKEADKLYAEQIGWIKEWIAGGAPWPDDARVQAIAKANAGKWSAEDGTPVKTSGGLAPEWTNRKYKPDGLWAYQPVKKPAPPLAETNPIDAFLAAKMPAGLPLAPAADARTFIRRATFDLTGLPPTPEAVAAFEAEAIANRQSAIGNLLSRLLASPHYGERLAQHWLDVTRYADSSGFANDYERGNAWRYRDYVVRAFNQDKPYDQFIREQIAGDEIAPNDPEMLVATGFLRMGPWELTSMEVARVARQRFLDDVTNGVGETFLAHSLQCARCHDHKFDPVPTRDYYSIQAVFATTQLVERPAPFLKDENTAGFEEKKYPEARLAEYVATLRALDAKLLANAEKWFAEKKPDRTAWEKAVTAVREAGPGTGRKGGHGRNFTGVFDMARSALQKQGVPEEQYPPKLVGFAPEDYGNERVARKGLERLKWELERYEPFAFGVYNGRTPQVTSVYQPIRMPQDRMQNGELEETCILTGGDPFGAGEKVKPGVLSVVPAETPAIPDAIDGRRKVFAEWVASAQNPLTTRAIVNRVWLWHFGQPLAGNPNNFGSTGKKPTHPELLDWLAATFVEKGWSFKELHRLIMTSDAYRRSATHPDRKLLTERDPTGMSCAVFQPRRLSAEELRDAMLAATGELNPTLGGIPNRPEINLEAALQPRQVMGTFASAWVPNPRPEQRHRRSLYALKLRGLTDPMQEVFNAPAPDFSCERREASTVTPQVFSLFNGQSSHARALALANRAVQETKNDSDAIARCFQLTFSRPPRADELESCLSHWDKITALLGDAKTLTPKPPLEVRRDAVEENTGEKFSFQEKLHAYADFVPDLQPADVPLRTRALADVCLALLNSNEFAYVY
jgi:mono/diheme cytochrome c family protein